MGLTSLGAYYFPIFSMVTLEEICCQSHELSLVIFSLIGKSASQVLCSFTVSKFVWVWDLSFLLNLPMIMAATYSDKCWAFLSSNIASFSFLNSLLLQHLLNAFWSAPFYHPHAHSTCSQPGKTWDRDCARYISVQWMNDSYRTHHGNRNKCTSPKKPDWPFIRENWGIS